jgi:hypothetical protein
MCRPSETGRDAGCHATGVANGAAHTGLDADSPPIAYANWWPHPTADWRTGAGFHLSCSFTGSRRDADLAAGERFLGWDGRPREECESG